MRTANTHCFYLATLLIILCSCGGSQAPHANATDTTAATAGKDTIVVDAAEVLENPVLTREQQQALTPQKVLDLLKEGNEDFVNDRLTIRNSSARIREAALSQYPKAMIYTKLPGRLYDCFTGGMRLKRLAVITQGITAVIDQPDNGTGKPYFLKQLVVVLQFFQGTRKAS